MSTTKLANPAEFSVIVFADFAVDFSVAGLAAADSVIPAGYTVEEVQFDLTSRATDEAVQSDKAPFGVQRAPLYLVKAHIEFVSTFPVDGDQFNFHAGGSPTSTVAAKNLAGLKGDADTDATSYADTAGRLAQLTSIGSLSLENLEKNMGKVGYYYPDEPFMQLVGINKSAIGTNGAGAMDKTHIAFIPLAYVI